MLVWFQLFSSSSGLPYKGTSATKVSLASSADIDDFRDAVKAKYADSHLSGIAPSDLLVYKNMAAFNNRNSGENALEEDSLVDGLGASKREALIVTFVQAPQDYGTFKKRLSDDLSEEIKKLRGSISKPLLYTSGSDFVFSDRNRSFQLLLECTRKRFDAWKEKKTDKMVHPIPFLADGPGSGKSRFLQELSTASFRDFVQQSDSSDEFKEIFKKTLFINIGFGNGTVYKDEDVDIGMEKAICLRILQQADPVNGREFVMKYDSKQETTSILHHTIVKLCGNDYECLLLGIDEVNKVHKADIRKLFAIVGSSSCSSPVFFVPVLAGTVIGSMTSIVTESMHPPCRIPLPLLSLESCKMILKKKIPKLATDDVRFGQLISDIGGHCRSLEYLYEALVSFNSDMADYWLNASLFVRNSLNSTYSVGNIALTRAIAHSFLSIPVGSDSIVMGNTTYTDLEETGIIKLVGKGEAFIVKIPFVFVWCHMQRQIDMEYQKFWLELLIGNDIGWQAWEVFNRNYIAFRLSLYSFLGLQTVDLKDFLSGAVCNIPVNTFINIPSIAQLKTSVCLKRYPSTNIPDLNPGDCVLNAAGAPFDAFVWVSTADSSKLVLAMQMKFSQKSNLAIDNRCINREYKKVKDSVGTQSDFLLLMLCQSDGNFDPDRLPSKVAIVSNSELLAFYGDPYYQRLKKC